MRGAGDLSLIETPLPELLREVSGLTPVSRGGHVLLDAGGIRSTQRIVLGDVGGGIAAFTWPAELVPQARHLYGAGRGPRLLETARDDRWDIDTRPHLAFRNAPPRQRLYMNPRIGVEEYVARWSGSDGLHIGAHYPDTIRKGLWPWRVERGHASPADEQELDPFLARLGRRPAHLRPGLRLLRRWDRDEIAELRARDALVQEIRGAVNRLLRAVDDPPLPARDMAR